MNMKKSIFAVVMALMSAVVSFAQVTPVDWEDESGNTWKLLAFTDAQILVRVQLDTYLGKYYNAQIILNNESADPIELDPSMMSASISKKGKIKELHVYDHDSYVKKLKAKAAAANFGAALLGGNSTGSQDYRLRADGSLSGNSTGSSNLNTESIDKFYVDHKVIASGESYLGMVNIDHKAGETLSLKLFILGAEYVFEFDVKNMK